MYFALGRCGVKIARIKEGDTVVDIGSGAGNNAFLLP